MSNQGLWAIAMWVFAAELQRTGFPRAARLAGVLSVVNGAFAAIEIVGLAGAWLWRRAS